MTTLIRILRSILFGADRELLESEAPAPQPILTDDERESLRRRVEEG